MPRGAARPRGGEAGGDSVVELLQQGVEQPVPQDVEAVHDGVRDVGPVAPERLPLVGRPLAVVGVVHGLVEHRVDERRVDGPEERHTLLVLLGLAGDDVVLEDVPEAEGHLGDGLLGGELGVAGGGGEDGGDQAQRHVPTLPAGARPVDQQAVGDSPKVMNRLSTGRHISKLPSDMYWCSTESRGRIFLRTSRSLFGYLWVSGWLTRLEPQGSSRPASRPTSHEVFNTLCKTEQLY